MARETISDQTRVEVWARQDGKCALCGDPLSESAHETHHLLRVADGGTNDVDNLVILCDRDEHLYVHGGKFGEAIQTEPSFYPFYYGGNDPLGDEQEQIKEENTEDLNQIKELEDETEIDEGLEEG